MAYFNQPLKEFEVAGLRRIIYPFDKDLSPKEFVDQYQHDLPILILVTDGYCGQNSIEFTFSSTEIYLVTHILTQERVLLKDHLGQQFSFPTDNRLKFFTLIDGVKSEESHQLAKILKLEQVSMSASNIQLIPDKSRNLSMHFCVGPDSQIMLDLHVVELMDMYDERYIVGSPIIYDNIVKKGSVIPMWMPISVAVAEGIKDETNPNEFVKVKRTVNRIAYDFGNEKTPGNKEIMLFVGDLDDCEGAYDTIAPANSEYQHLPPMRKVDGSTVDYGPAPELQPKGTTSLQTQRRKAPKPPKVTLSNTLFEKVSKLLKPKHTADQQDHQTVAEKAKIETQVSQDTIDNRAKLPDPPANPKPPANPDPPANPVYSYTLDHGASNILNADGYSKTKLSVEAIVKPVKTDSDIYGNPANEEVNDSSDDDGAYEVVPDDIDPPKPTVPVPKHHPIKSNTVPVLKPHPILSTMLSKQAIVKTVQTDDNQVPNTMDASGYLVVKNNGSQGAITPDQSKMPPNIAPKPKLAVMGKAKSADGATEVATSPSNSHPLTHSKSAHEANVTDETDFHDECEYVSFKQVPQSVSGMTVKQVADCLRLCKVPDDIVQNFIDQDVDGDLFSCLGEEELASTFSLKGVQLIKVKKFITGWRPKLD